VSGTLLRANRRERILVVVRGHLGDLVQALPALRDLRRARPQAHVTVLLNEYVASALEGCPYVDEVVSGFTYTHRNLIGSAANIARLLSRLAGRYNTVIGLRWSPTSTPILAVLAGARIRAGFDRTGKLGRLLTHDLGAEPIDAVSNRVINQLPIEALGIPVDLSYPEIDWLPTHVVQDTTDLLSARGLHPGKPFAVFQVSSHWGCGEWRSDKWAALGDYLADTYGLTVAITGTGEWFETSKFEHVRQLSRHAPVSLLGQTSVPHLFEVVRRARLVIAGDSGLAQVALAQRTPSVILFGIEEIEANGPLPMEAGKLMRTIQHWDKSISDEPPNPHCRFGESQCHGTSCREDVSRRRISVAEVSEQADVLLKHSLRAAHLG
jgi:ADP-heptose:LPS heptosyltransferase